MRILTYNTPLILEIFFYSDHDDYELEFMVHSPNKSSAFMAKSKRERDIWVQRIGEAMKAAIERKELSAKKRTIAGGRRRGGQNSKVGRTLGARIIV